MLSEQPELLGVHRSVPQWEKAHGIREKRAFYAAHIKDTPLEKRDPSTLYDGAGDALEAVRPVWWGAEDKPEHKECHKVSAHRGVSGADVAWGASGKKIGE